jgi:hypothetical protein
VKEAAFRQHFEDSSCKEYVPPISRQLITELCSTDDADRSAKTTASSDVAECFHSVKNVTVMPGAANCSDAAKERRQEETGADSLPNDEQRPWERQKAAVGGFTGDALAGLRGLLAEWWRRRSGRSSLPALASQRIHSDNQPQRRVDQVSGGLAWCWKRSPCSFLAGPTFRWSTSGGVKFRGLRSFSVAGSGFVAIPFPTIQLAA